MKVIKIMSILAILASLFGCNTPEPQILDGPGMVYVDSDHWNEYANCLSFSNYQGAPYLAVAYLGRGEVGEENKDVYSNKLFENLGEERISNIKTYDCGGDDWFLVVPKYHDRVIILKGEEETRTEYGVPFVVNCNSDVTLNIFNVTDMYFRLETDENGQLKGTEHDVLKVEDSTAWGQDNFVWDITHLINK